MEEYVLFSPIGDSDPINESHDAAMLHICRCYRPKHICLYLTAEMTKQHRHDDRYRRTLKLLYDSLGTDYTVEVIEHPEIINPHIFGQFDADYREILSGLHERFRGCTLLANISSGTPAMKSGVEAVAATSLFKVVTVQVSAYDNADKKSKGAKVREIKSEDYDVELHWETDIDNTEDFVNRCTEPDNQNFIALFVKENICRYAEAYDYQAALKEADSLSDLIPEEAVTLLKAAEERSRMIQGALSKHLGKELADRIIAPRSGDKAQLIEYVLWQIIKYKRGDITDFIRGLTPALYRLSLEYLNVILGIDLLDYCVTDSKNVKRLSRQKLENTEKGRDILQKLDARFAGYYDEVKPLSSVTCITIIREYANDKASAALESLRDVEQNLRHPLAHDVLPISEAIVKRNTGMGSDDIQKLLMTAAQGVLGMKADDWKSYDRINERLRSLLGQGLNR